MVNRPLKRWQAWVRIWRNFREIELENLEALIWTQYKAPLVNSASYSDVEASLDPVYMTKVNTEFMKAGVRGLTLVRDYEKNFALKFQLR